MHSEHPEIENELNAMERRLATWRPVIGALDRDRMLYEAGRAAARADARVQSWRLATAALILIGVGLGGLLAHERSQRQTLEVAIAAWVDARQPAGEIVSPEFREIPAIEPFAPDSYFALTSRFARGNRDLSSPDVDFEAEPHRPATGPLERLPQPRPLQPGDVQRVLDL